MRCLLSIALSLLSLSAALSQPYVEGGRSSQRFAQTTYGFDLMLAPGGGASQAAGLGTGSGAFAFPASLSPRLWISGLHFWGHADFYLAFPLRSLPLAKAPVSYRFTSGVETGARIFPWRIEEGKLRPFAGISMNSTDFRQADAGGSWGAWLARTRVPLQAGLLYARGRNLLDLSLRWHWASTQPYAIGRSQQTEVRTQALFFQVGIRRYAESTLSAEKGMRDGTYQRLEQRLQARRALDGFSLAIGPSSAFFLRPSPRAALDAPWMGERLRSSTFPDLGLGYFFNGPDAHLNLAFRPMRARNEGYGYTQTAARTSLALEAYKFVGNYHGFVPFVGASLSREWLRYSSSDQGQPAAELRRELFWGGITFGWDIRPTPVNTFLLRTNLRWYPGLSAGEGLRFDQLEFNFIQLVWYPGRQKKAAAALGGK